MGPPTRPRREAGRPANGARSRSDGPGRGAGPRACLAQDTSGMWRPVRGRTAGTLCGWETGNPRPRSGSGSQGEEQRGRQAQAAQTGTIMVISSFPPLKPAKSWNTAEADGTCAGALGGTTDRPRSPLQRRLHYLPTGSAAQERGARAADGARWPSGFQMLSLSRDDRNAIPTTLCG